MKTSAAPGNRLGKILAGNQMGQKGGTSRPEEGARGPSYEQASINPNDIGLGPGNYREARARTGKHKCHEDNNSLAVIIVCHMARWQGKEDHGHHLGQTYQSEGQRRMGSLIKFPAYRHSQHLLPERGEKTSDEV